MTAGGQAGASLPAIRRPLLPRGDSPGEGTHGTREESWSLVGHVSFPGAKHMLGGMGGLGARRLKFPLKMPTRGRHPVNSESWEPALPSAAQAPSSRPRCPGAGPGSRVQRSVTGAKGQPDVFGKPVWGAPSGGPGGSWGTVTSRLHPCGHTSGPSGEHGAPGRGRRAFGPSW